MNEDLKYTLNTINDWLKFAEAKNAGLLALNIASVFGLLQSDQIFKSGLKTFEGFLIILFCVSSCICLYTILPVVNKGFRFYKKLEESKLRQSFNELNGLFFGDLAKLSSDQFIQFFEFRHSVSLNNAEKDFGNQITNNAEICVQKFFFFKIASWFTFFAFVLGIFLILFNSILN
jgi:hypothetical protein